MLWYWTLNCNHTPLPVCYVRELNIPFLSCAPMSSPDIFPN